MFTRSGGVWTAQILSKQGYSVALSGDGNTALVGVPTAGYNGTVSVGAALIYTRSHGVWSQQAELVGTGTINSAGWDEQGFSVALSADGSTAILGGPDDNSGIGAAWVFARVRGVWSQQAKLVGTGAVGNTHSSQGYSVYLSDHGNTAIVGAPTDGSDDGHSPGAAWVFTRSRGVWSQEAKLVSTDAIGYAELGASVSLAGHGNTAIVGGAGDNNGTGAAWIFVRSHGVWNQQAKLVGAGAIGAAAQGASVSLSSDGKSAIVGGPGDNSDAGAAWVYTRSRGMWSQKAKLVGTNAIGNYSLQGSSVALSGDASTAIVGGPYDDPIYVGGPDWYVSFGAALVYTAGTPK